MAADDDDLARLDERAAAIIRAELARILASDAFRAAPQLSTFLSFIVERTMEGRATELKGYTIAVEGLGRPADFNPQIDPIVRVEAGRLRRALTQYYAGEGQDSTVRITMPVGGYVPVFDTGDLEAGTEWVPVPTSAERMAAELAKAAVPKRADRAAARRWSLATAMALALGFFALGWWYLGWPEPTLELASKRTTTTEQAVAPPPAAAASSLLRVAITIPTVPAEPRFAEILRRFSDVLVDAMARFDDVVTIKAPPPGSPAPPDVDYVLEMNVQSVDSGFEGLARLRSARDGRIVWTASSGRPSIELWQEADLGDMARRVATRLMEPFGIIPTDARQTSSSPTVRCILQAFDARRSMMPDDQRAARTCLSKLVDEEPGSYPAWAHLAIMTVGEHGSGLDQGELTANGAQGQQQRPLDRALAAALAAMRLAPSGARAYQAMMKVLLARGSVEEAIQKGQWAATRNPYDPDIMADLGSLYVRRGRLAEGMPLMERAVALSIARPARYDFYAFLGAYLSGASSKSAVYLAMLSADRGAFGLLAHALQAASDRDEPRLTAALAQLREKSQLFEKDPRAFFARKGFADEVTDKILAALGHEKR